MTTPIFTPQQVEQAIHHGMRGDRRRYEIGAAEAGQKNATYGSNRAHYHNVAQKCLREGDYLQAAEKSWGVYAQTIKGVSASYGVRVSTHANILSVAQSLSRLAFGVDSETGGRLRQGFRSAQILHQHFYENSLDEEEVRQSVGEVMDAVDLLQTLFERTS